MSPKFTVTSGRAVLSARRFGSGPMVVFSHPASPTGDAGAPPSQHVTDAPLEALDNALSVSG